MAILVAAILVEVAMIVLIFRKMPDDSVGANARASVAHRRERDLLASIECPTCKGSGVERVTAGQRLASDAAGGLLFGRKARAHFTCTNCGYSW
jgi:hypothetical protein